MMNTLDHMTADRLGELVDRFGRARVAVLGDFFLDKYLEVDPRLAEVSIETGRTAHQVVAIRHTPGAAGTVVCNLAALRAAGLHAIGLTGDDGESYELRKDLESVGCSTRHVHFDPTRRTPTYLKPRDVTDVTLAGEHERYDTKNRDRTTEAVERRILESFDALLPELDAVIAADQVEEDECGAITSRVREALAERAREHPGVIFWADSRRRIRLFRGVIVKPNQFETVGRESPPPGETVPMDRLAAAMVQLRESTGAPVCVTRGAEGMLVSDPVPTVVPGVRVDGPTDPTGAGDSATAGAVLALCAGATLPEAALVGNLVASITVEQLATTGTATPQQVADRLGLWQQQRRDR